MEKTKVFSVCDTIHDFDLKNNKFYDAFVQEHNIPSSGKIEKYIMNYMNIDKNDDNETIDLEYVRQTNLPSKRSVASAASTIEPIRKYNSKLQSSSTRSAASTLKQNSQIS